MSAVGIPAIPEGLRAGQLGVVVIGRVIMGDIAVTLVDLAQRKLLTVSKADGDWVLSPSAEAAAAGRRQSQLLGYEKRLLDGLVEVDGPARLSTLASRFGTALDESRSALVHEAVRRGWLRHLRHDQRTPKGEDLAREVRLFGHELRQLKTRSEVVAGDLLLPYALHFGLISGEQLPLARFAHAWVRTFAGQPGWAPPEP